MYAFEDQWESPLYFWGSKPIFYASDDRDRYSSYRVPPAPRLVVFFARNIIQFDRTGLLQQIFRFLREFT